MSIVTFNLSDGFAEAVVRGYRAGILTAADYSNLGQCDGLEGDLSHAFCLPKLLPAVRPSLRQSISRTVQCKIAGPGLPVLKFGAQPLHLENNLRIFVHIICGASVQEGMPYCVSQVFLTTHLMLESS
jgi:hypothetical protein